MTAFASVIVFEHDHEHKEIFRSYTFLHKQQDNRTCQSLVRTSFDLEKHDKTEHVICNAEYSTVAYFIRIS